MCIHFVPMSFASNTLPTTYKAMVMQTYTTLKRLVDTIGKGNADKEEYAHALRDMAVLFASPHLSVSSFELLQSGLVENLLQFASSKEGQGLFLAAYFFTAAQNSNSLFSPP